MARSIRPRRSMLYMPGSNARALEKAASIPADALIFDLEDAVAPDAKAEARRLVAAAAGNGRYGRRELLVRVNGLNTPWGYEDLVATAGSGADGVLLPKVDSPETVCQAEGVLEGAGAPADLAIWCMMETPIGILNAKEIARATPRLGGLVMGTSDLTKDLHASYTADRLPMLASFSLCLLAARAFGLAIADGVHLDLNDDAGFAAACRQGRALGFDGKTLIHPKTVDAANHIFAPDEAEVTWSRRIIAAHAEAAKKGKAVVLVDGKLIENLHVENARRLVGLADAIAALAGDAT